MAKRVSGEPEGSRSTRATAASAKSMFGVSRIAAAAASSKSRRQLEAFRADLAAERDLPPATVTLLRDCAHGGLEPMDALRIAAGTISMTPAAARAIPPHHANHAWWGPRIVAQFPTIVATFWHLRRGTEPLVPRRDLGHAANFLYMLSGEEPDPELVRALETYLNTVIDHGLNASTFTARVITSTGSDLVSSVVGALGGLKGPLHGGAPAPALDMVFEIGDPSRAEEILRRKIGHLFIVVIGRSHRKISSAAMSRRGRVVRLTHERAPRPGRESREEKVVTSATPTATRTHPRRLVRSTAAVFVGFISVAVLSLGTDQVLHVLNVYPPWGEPMYDPGLNLLALSYRILYAVVGGYITASLAPHLPMRHVLVVGILGFIAGSAGAFTAISMADLGPNWYPIALALTAFPCVWLGGVLYSVRHPE